MKIIEFSDIQFHAWQEFSKTLDNGLNSRFQDQLNVLDEIFAFARKQVDNDPDDSVLLIHTGDLFEAITEKIDKHVFLTVYEKFVRFSEDSGVLTVLIPGNHDWLDKTESKHILDPFKEIDHTLVVDEALVEIHEDAALGFIPYTSQNFVDKVNKLKSKIEKYHNVKYKYLFTHQSVNGAKVGPRDIILKHDYQYTDFVVDFFDVVFNGHYHKMQIFGAGFVIVGSPLQKDFGERGEPKGFWFLDTGKDPQRPKYIQTHAPRFHKIFVEDLMIKLPKDYKDVDFLWVVSTGPTEKEIRANLFAKGINLENIRIDIEKVKEQRTRTDISLNMAVEEQFKRAIEFMLHQLGKEMDADKLLSMALDLHKRSQN